MEQYVNQAANGSLIAAASALVAGGGTEDAAARSWPEYHVPRTWADRRSRRCWVAGSPTPGN